MTIKPHKLNETQTTKRRFFHTPEYHEFQFAFDIEARGELAKYRGLLFRR